MIINHAKWGWNISAYTNHRSPREKSLTLLIHPRIAPLRHRSPRITKHTIHKFTARRLDTHAHASQPRRGSATTHAPHIRNESGKKRVLTPPRFVRHRKRRNGGMRASKKGQNRRSRQACAPIPQKIMTSRFVRCLCDVLAWGERKRGRRARVSCARRKSAYICPNLPKSATKPQMCFWTFLKLNVEKA